MRRQSERQPTSPPSDRTASFSSSRTLRASAGGGQFCPRVALGRHGKMSGALGIHQGPFPALADLAGIGCMDHCGLLASVVLPWSSAARLSGLSLCNPGPQVRPTYGDRVLDRRPGIHAVWAAGEPRGGSGAVLRPPHGRVTLQTEANQRPGADGHRADMVSALVSSGLTAPLPLTRGEHLPAAPLIGNATIRHPASYPISP